MKPSHLIIVFFVLKLILSTLYFLTQTILVHERLCKRSMYKQQV